MVDYRFYIRGKLYSRVGSKWIKFYKKEIKYHWKRVTLWSDQWEVSQKDHHVIILGGPIKIAEIKILRIVMSNKEHGILFCKFFFDKLKPGFW